MSNSLRDGFGRRPCETFDLVAGVHLSEDEWQIRIHGTRLVHEAVKIFDAFNVRLDGKFFHEQSTPDTTVNGNRNSGRHG